MSRHDFGEILEADFTASKTSTIKHTKQQHETPSAAGFAAFVLYKHSVTKWGRAIKTTEQQNERTCS